MVQINIEKITSSTFSGYIYKHELTDEQQMLFPTLSEIIEIEGDFSIESKYKDEYTVIIESIFAIYAGTQLELNSDDVDMYEVSSYIEEKGPIRFWEMGA